VQKDAKTNAVHGPRNRSRPSPKAAAIDSILKQRPTICDLVYQDLSANRRTNARSVARGKSAEKVLLLIILIDNKITNKRKQEYYSAF
jgi:hypothetical protein